VMQHARVDPMLTGWVEGSDPHVKEATVRDHIDGWRGCLLLAGFGDEFIYEPGHSEPNRYWDPAVTRLWNHHRVVDAFIEVWSLTDGVAGSVNLDQLSIAASLAELFAVIERIGPRTGALRCGQGASGWQAPLAPTADEPI
jgi:hypothetical protein